MGYELHYQKLWFLIILRQVQSNKLHDLSAKDKSRHRATFVSNNILNKI